VEAGRDPVPARVWDGDRIRRFHRPHQSRIGQDGVALGEGAGARPAWRWSALPLVMLVFTVLADNPLIRGARDGIA